MKTKRPLINLALSAGVHLSLFLVSWLWLHCGSENLNRSVGIGAQSSSPLSVTLNNLSRTTPEKAVPNLHPDSPSGANTLPSSSLTSHKSTEFSHSGPLKTSATASSTGSDAVTVAVGDPYFAHVRAQIQAHSSYPPSLARRRIQGQAQIKITLAPSGSLMKVDLQQSSGHEELDRLALEAVKNATPYEAFESSQPARTLIIPLTFRLR